MKIDVDIIVFVLLSVWSTLKAFFILSLLIGIVWIWSAYFSTHMEPVMAYVIIATFNIVATYKALEVCWSLCSRWF